jgi:GNAT superfamily N-acetyltransferase
MAREDPNTRSASGLRVGVREIVEDDAAAVARLLGELGYPTDAVDLRHRTRRGGKLATGDVFVAERAGSVVGCMSLAFVPYFPDGSVVCRVTALVVAAVHRGQGIGRLLIARAIDEAHGQGCSVLEVTTADRRLDAHRFYERIGFTRTSFRFTRAV